MFYFIWDFLQGYLPNLDIPKIDVWPMIERHITKHAREKIPLQKLSNRSFLTKSITERDTLYKRSAGSFRARTGRDAPQRKRTASCVMPQSDIQMRGGEGLKEQKRESSN